MRRCPLRLAFKKIGRNVLLPRMREAFERQGVPIFSQCFFHGLLNVAFPSSSRRLFAFRNGRTRSLTLHRLFPTQTHNIREKNASRLPAFFNRHGHTGMSWRFFGRPASGIRRGRRLTDQRQRLNARTGFLNGAIYRHGNRFRYSVAARRSDFSMMSHIGTTRKLMESAARMFCRFSGSETIFPFMRRAVS